MIPKTDPRWQAAQDVLDAMQRFYDLDKWRGAVRWIEDTEGRVVIFTRGEYRDVLMSNISGHVPPIDYQVDGLFLCWEVRVRPSRKGEVPIGWGMLRIRILRLRIRPQHKYRSTKQPVYVVA